MLRVLLDRLVKSVGRCFIFKIYQEKNIFPKILDVWSRDASVIPLQKILMSFVPSVRHVRVAGKWTVYLFFKVKKIFVTPIVNKILQMSPTRLWVWPHCSWPRCPLSSWTDLWRLQVTIQINKQTNKQLNKCFQVSGGWLSVRPLSSRPRRPVPERPDVPGLQVSTAGL